MSLIGKKILGILNKPTRQKENKTIVPFEAATGLGIMYTWDGKNKENALGQFIEEIADGKSVKVLCFNSSKESVNSKHPVVNANEISTLGKINSEHAQGFINEAFDYLFHFDLEMNQMTKSILGKSQAKCRVGLHTKSHASFYELMIGLNKSSGIEHLAEQMIKYVKAIR